MKDVAESCKRDVCVVKSDVFSMLVFFAPDSAVKISEIKLYDELPELSFNIKNLNHLPKLLKDSLLKLAALEKETLPEEFFDLSEISSSRLEVLRVLRSKVLRGKVITYSGLAALAGFSPKASRFAGTCMATNPFPLYYPCHRVVRSGGFTGNYGPGKDMKIRILEREAVRFNSDGTVHPDCIIA